MTQIFRAKRGGLGPEDQQGHPELVCGTTLPVCGNTGGLAAWLIYLSASLVHQPVPWQRLRAPHAQGAAGVTGRRWPLGGGGEASQKPLSQGPRCPGGDGMLGSPEVARKHPFSVKATLQVKLGGDGDTGVSF